MRDPYEYPARQIIAGTDTPYTPGGLIEPLHNVLLSSHAYWAACDGMPHLQQSIANNLPIVFGEMANKQDGDDTHPYYDLDGSGEYGTPLFSFTYQSFLQSLLGDQVGWLAWSWARMTAPSACSAATAASTR